VFEHSDQRERDAAGRGDDRMIPPTRGKRRPPILIDLPSQPSHRTVFSQLPRVSMEPKSQRPKDREGVISVLNATIEAMNLAKEISSITPAKAAFGAVSALLVMLKVCFFLFCYDLLKTHISRTRWPTKWISLSLGYIAPISVERLSGG